MCLAGASTELYDAIFAYFDVFSRRNRTADAYGNRIQNATAWYSDVDYANSLLETF